jgi:hypothetical protein
MSVPPGGDRLERWAPTALGLLAVAFWVSGSLVLELATTGPDTVAGDEWLAYFRDEPRVIFAGAFLFDLGGVAFLCFLGALRARLAGDGGARWLADVAFAGGVAAGVCSFGILGGLTVGALDREGITPATAEVLGQIGDLFFLGAQVAMIPLAAAVGLAALRTQALPPWLGWPSVAVAGTLAFPLVGWAVLLVAVPIWVAALSLALAPTQALTDAAPSPARSPVS